MQKRFGSVTRSSFDEWNINSCSGGCKRGGSESICVCVCCAHVRSRRWRRGRRTHRWHLNWPPVPDASLSSRASPAQAVTVSQQPGRALGRALGARWLHWVLPRVLGAPVLCCLPCSHTNTLLLLAPSFLQSTRSHCQHQSIWGEFRRRKARGQQRPGRLCVKSIHTEAPRSSFSATSCSVWIEIPPSPTSALLIYSLLMSCKHPVSDQATVALPSNYRPLTLSLSPHALHPLTLDTWRFSRITRKLGRINLFTLTEGLSEAHKDVLGHMTVHLFDLKRVQTDTMWLNK